jgi:hypothetical protein
VIKLFGKLLTSKKSNGSEGSVGNQLFAGKGETMTTLYLTPWFNAKTDLPVRKGFYEFLGVFLAEPSLMYWDGESFHFSTGGKALILRGDQWRGVLK